MKKGIVALALVSVVAFAVADIYARGWGNHHRGGYGRGNGPGYGHRGFGCIEFLKAELGLSENQVEKIFKINSEYRFKYYKNRDSYKKIDELRIQHRKAIENVLTKTQKEKFNNSRNYRGYGRYRGRPYR